MSESRLPQCPSSFAYLYYIFQATPSHTFLLFTLTKNQCYLLGPFLNSGDHSLAVRAGTNPLDLHIVNLHLYRKSRLDGNKNIP